MKLIIQIPCLNERDQLPLTLADLPRTLAGIDEIEVLVIDDGSSDGTSEVAAKHGAHHVVRFARNRGLSAAHMAGLDAAFRLGADIVVNTDADNQYCGSDIAALIAPVLAGTHDLVIGDRQTHQIAEFSPLKRRLQRLGTWLVAQAAGFPISDATSGFRAMNRRAMSMLFVHNSFTYTVESLVQAGRSGLAVANVKIATNRQTRPSRLFRSMAGYIMRNGPVILRAYAMYNPVRTLGGLMALLLGSGTVAVGRFLYLYFTVPTHSGHVQSLVLGVGLIVLGFLVALFAGVSELLAANRRLIEEALVRARRVEFALSQVEQKLLVAPSIPGVSSTGSPPWRAEAK